MLLEWAKIEYKLSAVQEMYSMLESVYNIACAEAVKFNWDKVPEFDRAHYKKVFSMVYNGACPIKSIPIKDEVLKRELWEYARCYTISDMNNNLAYTYLVGKNRFPKTVLSDRTKNALGLHVGDLSGVKLQDNFLSKVLSVLLFDIAFPDNKINFNHVSEIVRMRLFNDSRNMINRNGETYELYNKDGAPILYVKPAKTFFTRRDTVNIKYPRGGIKIFDKPSIEERQWLLTNLSERYNAKCK